MKTITVDEFLNLRPCYGEEKIREIAGDKKWWSALDILRLENVPREDRLWAVLRPEPLDDALLHEFVCRCAERVLSKSKTPDPRSFAAIAAKRAWLRGEISDEELKQARVAARAAARATWPVAWSAASAASKAASWDEREAAREAEREWQMAELIKMLEE